MTDHEQWDELAAGYALHALAPDEEITFAEHLDSCARCAASVGDHEFVAAQLGSIAHFRDTDEAPSWDSLRAAVVGAPETSTLADLGARRHRYDVSRRVLAVAAAAAILAGGGIVTWRLSTGGSSCASSAGCHVITLDAAAGHRAASVTVRKNAVAVTPTDLPSAPMGKVYVLWQLPRNGRATPVETFMVGSGTTPATGALKVPYSDTAAFAVSLENANGALPSAPSNTVAAGATT